MMLGGSVRAFIHLATAGQLALGSSRSATAPA